MKTALNTAGLATGTAAALLPIVWAWGAHDGPPWLQAHEGRPLALACFLLGGVLGFIALFCFAKANPEFVS